jgi:hypothetical protein
MIKVLQKTQEFERYLVQRFKNGGSGEVYEKQDGSIEFDVGDAKEIKEKYKKKDTGS